MKMKKILALVISLALLLCVPGFAEEHSGGEWWNILLLGSDERREGVAGRTDSMMILSVNLETREAKLTSLMRDIWVSIDGHGYNKLNAACYYGGPELIMKTVNQNFGTDITDYALVNITCMADIIDILGGVELDVTEAERKALNKGLFDLSSQSGMEELEESGEGVLLNGNQAVAYARIRQIDSDFQRTERQRTVLTAIAAKLRDQDWFTILSVLGTLLPYVDTNLDFMEMSSLAALGLELETDGIGQLRLPAEGTYESGTYSGTWCIKADFDKNSRILHDFIYGE